MIRGLSMLKLSLKFKFCLTPPHTHKLEFFPHFKLFIRLTVEFCGHFAYSAEVVFFCILSVAHC